MTKFQLQRHLNFQPNYGQASKLAGLCHAKLKCKKRSLNERGDGKLENIYTCMCVCVWTNDKCICSIR